MDEAAISRIVINRLVAAGAPREDAEDCAQEALIATWQAKAQDRVIADPVAWATTVARRRYIDVIRRERRQRTCLESTEHDRTAPSPEQSAVERAHARWLADCIRELPASTQLVCELAGAGQAQRDISERLEVSLRSAESHIARARRFLRGKAALVATVVLLRPWAWLREHSVAGGVAIGAVGTTAVVVLLPAEVAAGLDPGSPAQADAAPIIRDRHAPAARDYPAGRTRSRTEDEGIRSPVHAAAESATPAKPPVQPTPLTTPPNRGNTLQAIDPRPELLIGTAKSSADSTLAGASEPPDQRVPDDAADPVGEAEGSAGSIEE